MKTPSITKERIDVNLADEVMLFGARVGVVVCALIGIWAVAALISGLVSAGPVGMIQGYITAITGV